MAPSARSFRTARGFLLPVVFAGTLLIFAKCLVSVDNPLFATEQRGSAEGPSRLSKRGALVYRRAVAPEQGQPHRLLANVLSVGKDGDDNTKSAENYTGEYAGLWAGTLPRLDTRPLFYNRVPKSGSEMFVLLLQWLQGYNGFKHIRLPNTKQRMINETEQRRLAQTIKDMTELHGVPCSFDRHVYFVNFQNLSEPMPIYINMVRDPVEKAISRYFYHRIGFSKEYDNITSKSNISKEEWKRQLFEDCVRRKEPECQFISGLPYDLTIPYFCGNDERCKVLNDPWALEQAKRNMEEHFAVVGVLEDVNTTLSVFEHLLPNYFSGLSHMFYKELLTPKRNKNLERPKDIAEDIRNELSTNLTSEYDLYNYAVQRLQTQWKRIHSSA